MNLADQLESAGFACRDGVLTGPACDRLLSAVAAWDSARGKPDRAGARNLLRDLPAVANLADTVGVRELVDPVLGSRAFPVRVLWFDKTPGANWKVPWHQDLAIAADGPRDVPGFSGWSVKDGVTHVHPPAAILDRMITVRLHLDACDADNGPLRVLPGSHREARLDPAAITRWRAVVEPVECRVPRGGAVVMRPLLLHASSMARRPGHRRVLHLEFAAEELPGGLRWAFRPPSA